MSSSLVLKLNELRRDVQEFAQVTNQSQLTFNEQTLAVWQIFICYLLLNHYFGVFRSYVLEWILIIWAQVIISQTHSFSFYNCSIIFRSSRRCYGHRRLLLSHSLISSCDAILRNFPNCVHNLTLSQYIPALLDILWSTSSVSVKKQIWRLFSQSYGQRQQNNALEGVSGGRWLLMER